MEDKYKDENLKGSLTGLLNWVSKHKIFTIVVLILLIAGFERVVKHFEKKV